MQRYTTEYDAQAGEFMRKWGVKIHRHFVGKMRYFPNDREPRNVWEITLERSDGRRYSFRFGDSLANTQKFPRREPSDYSILACVSMFELRDAYNCRFGESVWSEDGYLETRDEFMRHAEPEVRYYFGGTLDYHW